MMPPVSVAFVATVLNAMLLLLNRKSDFGYITQEKILEKVKAANWAERISREGFRNRWGLPIAELGIVVKNAPEQFDIPYKEQPFLWQNEHFKIRKQL